MDRTNALFVLTSALTHFLSQPARGVQIARNHKPGAKDKKQAPYPKKSHVALPYQHNKRDDAYSKSYQAAVESQKAKGDRAPGSKRNAGNTINRIATVSATLIKNLPLPLLVAAFHDVLHKHRGALQNP